MLGVWFIKKFDLYKNKMFYTRLGAHSYGSVKIKNFLKTLIFLNSAQYVRGLVRGVIWKKNQQKFWIKIPVSDSSPLSMLGGGFWFRGGGFASYTPPENSTKKHCFAQYS